MLKLLWKIHAKHIGILPSSSIHFSLHFEFYTLNKTKPKVKYGNGKYRDRAIMTMTTTKNANKIKNYAGGGFECLGMNVEIRQ